MGNGNDPPARGEKHKSNEELVASQTTIYNYLFIATHVVSYDII